MEAGGKYKGGKHGRVNVGKSDKVVPGKVAKKASGRQDMNDDHHDHPYLLQEPTGRREMRSAEQVNDKTATQEGVTEVAEMEGIFG